MGRLLDTLRGALRSRNADEQLAGLDAIEQAGATEMVESLMEQSVQGAEIDPNDPDFAAVDGMDIDRYARICKEIVDGGQQSDESELRAILAGHGLEASAWVKIGETWNERIMRNPKVKMRYTASFLGR